MAASGDLNRVSNAAIHWFRKDLRLHDNPALLDAARNSQQLFPVYVLDPAVDADPFSVGPNRVRFLLQCLADLDRGLRALGSQLIVVRGRPVEVLPRLIQQWDVQLVTWETQYEPVARERDAAVCRVLSAQKVRYAEHASRTLFDLEQYLATKQGHAPPGTYGAFCTLFDKMGPPRRPLPAPASGALPAPGPLHTMNAAVNHIGIPTLEALGYDPASADDAALAFPGGESEALRRLQRLVTERPAWVAAFAKPDTSPNALEPSTTVLSPYVSSGCLSPARFYYALEDAYTAAGRRTQPPVSLHGQLLWREFFYLSGYTTPHFDRVEGNAACRQIPWLADSDRLAAWKEARTGYPFIDAIMTQLRRQGWIHHLARHAVACFLTRGDLWQSWVDGVRVFDYYLLDDDWALNNANWQWLSCSRFFHQYFRVYSPIAFGKKTDPSGAYIRHWLPQLARLPASAIYAPWTATKDMQTRAGCIIGRDYPAPIVEHDAVLSVNMRRMRLAFGGSSEPLAPVDDAKATASPTKSPVKRPNSKAAADLPSAFKRAAVHGSRLSRR